jgi:hypothetical protein
MNRFSCDLGYGTVHVVKKPAAAMSRAVQCHRYGGSQLLHNFSKYSVTQDLCLPIISSDIGSMATIDKYDGN